MSRRLPFTIEQARSWREKWPTPFYVYDEEAIRARVRSLCDAFSWNAGFRENFAVKALPTPAVLRLLRSLGCGADCASISEIELALRSGVPGDEIVMSSNETSDAEYRAARKAGAVIDFDDITQIDNMDRACGIPEAVCCRINPGEFRGTNEIIGHLRESKFGMTVPQLFDALELLRRRGAKRFGLHAMLASCSLDTGYYPDLARELFKLAVEVDERLGIKVSFIDLAGGIGIPYRPGEREVDIAAAGRGVREAYEEILKPRGIEPALFAELGRWITGPCGYLVTTVIGRKDTYKKYVGVDATACDLMRPAMYGAYHHASIVGREDEAETETVDIVGSLCENNDKFAVDRAMPKAEPGDMIAIFDAGAHGRSMGYNYNGKLRPAELMLGADGEARLIRRAETIADYFATLDVDEEFVRASAGR